MKNFFKKVIAFSFSSRILILAALVIFAGSCKKDTQLPTSMSKAIKLPGEIPLSNFGSIKGYTTPVSRDATYRLINTAGQIFTGKINADGSFMVENLPAGILTRPSTPFSIGVPI